MAQNTVSQRVREALRSTSDPGFRNSYNKAPNEILADSGFGGRAAVGAGRPGHATTTTSYCAFGDQVSSALGRSTSGSGIVDASAADDSAGNLAAFCSER